MNLYIIYNDKLCLHKIDSNSFTTSKISEKILINIRLSDLPTFRQLRARLTPYFHGVLIFHIRSENINSLQGSWRSHHR